MPSRTLQPSTGTAQCGRLDFRPARRRRQLFDERHRAAAGLRRQRDRALPGRSRRCCPSGLRRPVRATAGRRRGSHQARGRHRDRCRFAGRRVDRRARRGPRQPGQDRAVRLRPELGPGPGSRRHGAGRAGARPDHRVVQRFRGVHRRCRRTWCARGRPLRCRHRCDNRSRGRRRRASIRTTDLSHGYVEENSAYSS